jgi:lipoprotein-anchoring transpeptidase ErfK/SrfK
MKFFPARIFPLLLVSFLTKSVTAQSPSTKSSTGSVKVTPDVVKAKPLLDPESVPLKNPLQSQIAKEDKPLGEDAVRLQIFLDQANFGPGVIDGKPGLFTENAVKAWNEVHGHSLDNWTAVMAAAKRSVPEPVVTATVPDILGKWVNPRLTNDRILQSKEKRLGYRSAAELMAERYHTDIEFLLEINNAKKINGLKVGSEILVPNVKPFEIEAIAGIQHKRDELKAQRHVVVDTKRNQLRIFEAAPAALVIEENPDENAVAPAKPAANRSLIASFPITPGKPQFIHYGMWEVRTQVEFPTWSYDKLLLHTGKRNPDKSQIYQLPPGPNCPVGVIWCGLSKSGIGLHGTSDPETIGRAQSAGCIRLSNWDAIRLPTLISPGSSVEIR